MDMTTSLLEFESHTDVQEDSVTGWIQSDEDQFVWRRGGGHC